MSTEIIGTVSAALLFSPKVFTVELMCKENASYKSKVEEDFFTLIFYLSREEWIRLLF